jgi:DNA-binding FadR family transcriptional regulator
MGKSRRQALDELRGMLDQLAPEHGDRLPSERALIRTLACSRQTLRACYTTLETEGVIWRHVGQGTFRGRRPAHAPIREMLLVEGATPPDLMRARLLLEPQVAAEAAMRAEPDDIVTLRAKVAAGRKSRDLTACEQADDAFHRAIAEVSGNPVLIGLLVYLSGARRRVAWQREWQRTYQRIPQDQFQTVHSDQHEEVVNAIAQREPEAAFAAMQKHLHTIIAAMIPPENKVP